MILKNIKPGSADVTVASIKYGRVERLGDGRWYSYDKDGETLGMGRESRSNAAYAILRYYREQAAKS